MTDQTPRTEAGRKRYAVSPTLLATILAVEAEAAAQARAEGLDVEVLAWALEATEARTVTENKSVEDLWKRHYRVRAADIIRAILAGETE